ncbi:TPA: hypothetical protein QC153_002163 [Bacillus cereus]|nr:hypothetical protein [Bacillus cereus]
MKNTNYNAINDVLTESVKRFMQNQQQQNEEENLKGYLESNIKQYAVVHNLGNKLLNGGSIDGEQLSTEEREALDFMRTALTERLQSLEEELQSL